MSKAKIPENGSKTPFSAKKKKKQKKKTNTFQSKQEYIFSAVQTWRTIDFAFKLEFFKKEFVIQLYLLNCSEQ